MTKAVFIIMFFAKLLKISELKFAKVFTTNSNLLTLPENSLTFQQVQVQRHMCDIDVLN